MSFRNVLVACSILSFHSSLATVSNDLIFFFKIIYIENEPRFSQSESISHVNTGALAHNAARMSGTTGDIKMAAPINYVKEPIVYNCICM